MNLNECFSKDTKPKQPELVNFREEARCNLNHWMKDSMDHLHYSALVGTKVDFMILDDPLKDPGLPQKSRHKLDQQHFIAALAQYGEDNPPSIEQWHTIHAAACELTTRAVIDVLEVNSNQKNIWPTN